MAASSTDKFKKGARKWVGQIGAAGVSDASVTTIPLASATSLPTDTGVVAVIDRVDSAGTKTPSLEETVVGVVSGSNLVTCVRGAEGTAQAHLAGAVVEILITNKGWNDMVDGILAEHSQAGAHTAASATASGVVELATTAETTTGTDATRAVTPDGLHDMTSLSGAAWMLDEDTMSSNSDTKVPSQQSVKAYADTYFTPTNGWVSANETWTYASASTFTVAGVDVTTKYVTGTKIKWTQTTVKYGVVVSSSFSTDTTVTIAVNTDYTIANAAISSNFYSYADVPAGYPGWFNWTAGATWNGTPPSGTTATTAKYSINGRTVHFRFRQSSATAGATNTQLTIAAPTSTCQGTASEYHTPCVALLGTATGGTAPDTQGRGLIYDTSSPTIYAFFASIAAKQAQIFGTYEL